MKKYIYMFEDGSVCQSKTPPTKEDLMCVEAGVLDFLVIDDQVNGKGDLLILDRDGENLKESKLVRYRDDDREYHSIPDYGQ